MSDFDLLTKFYKVTEDEAKEIIARNKIQKYEDAKLQIVMQNPQILGVGVPGPDVEEMGTEVGGPGPMLSPDQNTEGGLPPEDGAAGAAAPNEGPQPSGTGGAPALPDASPDLIKKYDLEIQSYAKDQDIEEIDFSTGD